ncbi:MAG: glycosyltransferase [Planctomycetes bacterium]|nr:glycosyltransferase [Planctomycetota bacterium]
MKIVFDAICLGDGRVTGVARSFLNGLHAYAARYAADMIVLVPDGADHGELPTVEIAAGPRGAVRRQRVLPRLLRDCNADLLHSSVASVPLRARCPTIATVHDLPWLHDESGERSNWWRRFATTRALRAAAAVIAPSRFTLEAAAKILGDRSRLHHIPHTTRAPATIGDARERTGPLLVLGDDRPRKNRARVRQAHRLARQRVADLPELRFVGPPHDYVAEVEKERLLRTCRAVVACSLYEGFGMPVLEALAHGAPLICSDIPPHREIAGAAARYVDPRDVESIANGLIAEPVPHDGPMPGRPIAACWRSVHTLLLG